MSLGEYITAIPDRQVIRLLEFLYLKLNADRYLDKYLDTMKHPVSTTLAMPFVTGTNQVQKVHAQGLPYLAVWRDSGRRERERVGFSFTIADFGIGWMCRFPGVGQDHAAGAHGAAWVNLVWDRMCHHMEEITEESQNTIGAEDIEPIQYTLVSAEKENLIGFSGTIRVSHSYPLITEEEGPLLDTVALNIKLYKPTDTDTGFTVSGELT